MNDKNTNVQASYFFVGQFQHLLLLACLLPGVLFLASASLEHTLWMGVSGKTWLYSLLIVIVLQQVIGWLVLRSQLCFSFLSRTFGKYDMLIWSLIFIPLLLLRFLLTLAVGFADAGSLTQYRSLQITLGILLLIPTFYTFWSISKYFGWARALGGDHFRQKYREMPIVNQGAFRYSSNAMYTYAFFAFWAVALLTGSAAALAVALFQHAYIWVHWYCTEEPDMRIIYGS